ncbi:MAG: hypothetical protein O2887_10465 [Bacteroidetes bacterium]|nr:hypothetical protein [Bacteroidota bacterium]
MKDFLKKTFLRLPITSGIDQAQKLGPSGSKELIADLEKTCNRFKLPERIKEQIIDDGIMNDPDFYGLNSKILFKWFSRYIERMKLTAPQSHVDISEIERENEIKYKKMLEEKKRQNPDYNPEKEAIRIAQELAEKTTVSRGKGLGQRIKEQLEILNEWEGLKNN